MIKINKKKELEGEINKKVTDHLNELSIQAQYDLNEDVVPKI